MKTFRIVLGILTIIPLALLSDKFLFYHPEYEAFDDYFLETLLYHAIGVPILILNLLAWLAPETIEAFFFKKDK